MVKRIVVMSLVAFALVACDDVTNPIPVDRDVVRLEAVTMVGTLNRDRYTGLTADGQITSDISQRVDQRTFDPILHARIMSDGSRWVPTGTRTADDVPIFNVVSVEGTFLYPVAVAYPIDARGTLVLARDRDDSLYLLNMSEDLTRR